MKEYRKRFIQLNMLLVGVVLTFMMAAIAFYMYRDYYVGLKATMEQVVEPWESVPEPVGDEQPPGHTEKEQEPDSKKGIMTVFYTPEKENIDILSQAFEFEEVTLEQILDEVVSRKKNFGTLIGHQLIYYCTGNGNPYKIALASTGYIGHSMLRLSGVLIAVWVGAMLCFLMVSCHFSRVAVRPMEEAVQREKQFIADASHDLKTPLSVILANNSILMEAPEATAGSLKRWILSTQNAAEKMQELIGEMLTLADVERPDVPVVMEDVDVASVVTRAALQLEYVAYEKHVDLEMDIPEQTIIRANEDYIQRIAESLIENAIKYEPGGGGVFIGLTETKQMVLLEIQNRSTVISGEDLPHIFERFYRSDKSRQDHTGGHGLGLAITKEMVEKLGGDIQAKSSREIGTVFSISLKR